jgi:uncharacterized membrane protein YeaQ/YmgE (transglycosylase-associated protein family)
MSWLWWLLLGFVLGLVFAVLADAFYDAYDPDKID